MNNNSGGPSIASSAVCSSPILLISQTCKRRSEPLDAKMVSFCDDHCTWKISSWCDSKECTFNERLRISHKPTVWSAEPVATKQPKFQLDAPLLNASVESGCLLLYPKSTVNDRRRRRQKYAGYSNAKPRLLQYVCGLQILTKRPSIQLPLTWR
ncbi:conserved hypothetical protein [Trichinella spiralis]|uniref:hypothetical protein n=1 Tax=Trichinella spiralis TaxID=6334 RepID=UPI0001EFE8AD|nr:conserved hypothetical protein [Trichinella spiralis]